MTISHGAAEVATSRRVASAPSPLLPVTSHRSSSTISHSRLRQTSTIFESWNGGCATVSPVHSTALRAFDDSAGSPVLVPEGRCAGRPAAELAAGGGAATVEAELELAVGRRAAAAEAELELAAGCGAATAEEEPELATGSGAATAEAELELAAGREAAAAEAELKLAAGCGAAAAEVTLARSAEPEAELVARR